MHGQGMANDEPERAEWLRQRLAERAVCEATHTERVPHNGLGWIGTRCPKCGFMFFGEWEDWAKEITKN